MGKEKRFYLVREDILPEAILKTAQAKEMLARGDADNILDAVDKLRMSRSTYYKYKDGVYAFFDTGNVEIINISLLLQHISGILSGVLNCIAGYQGNVLSINQNLPLHGVAYVTVTLSVEELMVSIEHLLNSLRGLQGVLNVEIIGKS